MKSKWKAKIHNNRGYRLCPKLSFGVGYYVAIPPLGLQTLLQSLQFTERWKIYYCIFRYQIGQLMKYKQN